ncbi:unnamed protein product [Amoebophrya sp. A120]|nr:unnamed protein product [Amoebophrya sp. A120]|eukprot:GSA120T00011567001.1
MFNFPRHVGIIPMAQRLDAGRPESRPTPSSSSSSSSAPRCDENRAEKRPHTFRFAVRGSSPRCTTTDKTSAFLFTTRAINYLWWKNRNLVRAEELLQLKHDGSLSKPPGVDNKPQIKRKSSGDHRTSGNLRRRATRGGTGPYSFTENEGRLHVATVAANSPSEDTYSLEERDGVTLASVLDGHGGPQVAHFASENLIKLFFRNVTGGNKGKTSSSWFGGTSSNAAQLPGTKVAKTVDDVAQSLVDAYREVDEMCWDRCQPCCELGFLNVARVGSCAVSAVVWKDPAAANKPTGGSSSAATSPRRSVVVANVGDCRCMLGRTSRKGRNNTTDAALSTTSPKLRFVPSSRLNKDYNRLMSDMTTRPPNGATSGTTASASAPPSPASPTTDAPATTSSAGGVLEGVTLTTLHNVNDPLCRAIMRRDFPEDPDIVQCIQGWQDQVTGNFSRLRPLDNFNMAQLRPRMFNNEQTDTDSADDHDPGVQTQSIGAALGASAFGASGANSRWQPAEFSCYVKGCLQPTRSFGDFYLKRRSATFDPVTRLPLVHSPRHLPYISAEPDVRIYEGLTSDDKFLVLASDGLWDFLTEEEVLDTLEPYFLPDSSGAVQLKPKRADKNSSRSEEEKDASSDDNSEDTAANKDVNFAQLLLDRLLERISRENSLGSPSQLRQVPPNARRKMFDDTTVVVIVL